LPANGHGGFVPPKMMKKWLCLVIPAKAGIQLFNELHASWIPAFAGMTAKSEAP
jgi:hypothetical protein